MALDIARRRLNNQRIEIKGLDFPAQVVNWFGTMQAQDYAGVKWAVGLRCAGTTDADVEEAFADGSIIRTWLNRGTLQIVTAEDVRWMLALLGPRLISQSARRRRQLALGDDVLMASFKIITQSLRDKGLLTRKELLNNLEQAGIPTPGARGYHILRHAGLEGLICFGPMRGKEETFVLLEEWSPDVRRLETDEALAALALRYFRSHGPATLEDFAWWSGLPRAKARAGLAMIKPQLREKMVAGTVYWLPTGPTTAETEQPMVHLLPAYDEFYLGYRDREAVLDAAYDKKAISSSGVFRPMIVVNGQIVGIWKRTLKKKVVVISPKLFRSLTVLEREAFQAAVVRYGAFLGQTADIAGQ